MRPFRFRAAIVLDLRQKQDETAQRHLLLAQADSQRAEAGLRAAEEALAAAMVRAAEAERDASAVTVLQWYRNWMAGRQREVAQAREERDASQAALERAAAEADKARRQLRVRERYRDRVWQAWQHEAMREEQKALDLLGTLQHAARRPAPGGSEWP